MFKTMMTDAEWANLRSLDALLVPHGRGMKFAGILKTEEDKGWLAAISGSPLDEQLLSLVPRDATSFVLSAVDLGQVYALTMDMLEENPLARLKAMKGMMIPGRDMKEGAGAGFGRPPAGREMPGMAPQPGRRSEPRRGTGRDVRGGQRTDRNRQGDPERSNSFI